MTKSFLLGLLAFVISSSAVSAQSGICDGTRCGTVNYQLTSVSDHARYGLLVLSPDDTLCHSIQFVVTAGAGILGRSQVLLPGEVQVVRIGAGFAQGDHALQITASGCPVQPLAVRRVRLGKPSPDHGWRATAFLQAQLAL